MTSSGSLKWNMDATKRGFTKTGHKGSDGPAVAPMRA